MKLRMFWTSLAAGWPLFGSGRVSKFMAIHRFVPGGTIQKIDTVFRAPLIVDSSPVAKGVVTHVDEDEGTAELDLTLELPVGTLVWMISEASKFVTGIVVPVDGGFSAYSGV